MIIKRLLFMLFALAASWNTAYGSEPTWMTIPIVAGDSDGVYMRVKTNKQTYTVGEVIYATVYVSGLNFGEDDKKEILIRVEGHGIAPSVLNAETISGTASGIVGVTASNAEAVKLDIVAEYGDNRTLSGSVPLEFSSVSAPTSSPQTLAVDIELIDIEGKGGDLPKTSDISPSSYAMGCLTFIATAICLLTVGRLTQKKNPSCSTIPSEMYGRVCGGHIDIYSEKEDSNERQNN